MTGRAPDDAVAFYCHMKLTEILKEKTQKQVADESGISGPAVNLLMKTGRGVGSSTAARFAKFLGFETRGQLVDAADTWWSTEGYQYAVQFLRTRAEAIRPQRAPKEKRPAAQAAAPERQTRRHDPKRKIA